MNHFLNKVFTKKPKAGKSYRTSDDIMVFTESITPGLTQDIQDKRMLQLMRLDNIFDTSRKPNTRMSKAECAYCANKMLTIQSIVKEGCNNYRTKYENEIRPKQDAYNELIRAGKNDEKLFAEIQAFYTAEHLKKYIDEAMHHAVAEFSINELAVCNTKETIDMYLDVARIESTGFIFLAVLCDTCAEFDFLGFEK